MERAWFARDAPTVAAELLGKLLLTNGPHGRIAARIVEVEAYTQDDPASHSHRGRTARNAVMFGPPGHLYVYLSYGVHQCANVVTGPVGVGQAVLLRGVEPVAGIEVMRARRPGRSDRDLCNGPGKLCQALAITATANGLDLLSPGSAIALGDDGTDPPTDPLVGPRIGISRGIEIPWRFRMRHGSASSSSATNQ
jgi:DNA-3-methyladenine glycosylase